MNKTPKTRNTLLVVLIVLLLIFTVGKDFIIKTAITTIGADIVGAPIEIGSFSLGLLSQKIHIKNLKVYNPDGFPKEPLINLPEIRLDYDVLAFLSGKIHARLVLVNMKEMNVVINKEGKLNVDSLKVVEEAKKKKDNGNQKVPPFQIDVMKLNIEKVVLKDFSKGGEPVVQVYENVLRDKEFKNINSVGQMITLIMVQGLGPTAIRSAGIYAAATILGAGFLPAGIVGVLVSKDDSVAEFGQSPDKVFETALVVLKQKGEVRSEDKASGMIKGKYSGVDLNIKIEKGEKKRTKLVVTARKMMLPKPEIAAGFVYELEARLK